MSDSEELEKHLVVGGELLRRNRVQEARAALQKALEIDPENARAQALLGLACFRMDDFRSALPVYQKLVALNPNDASFRLNLGLVHLKLGDAAGAIRELTRSRDLDPGQSRAVSYLGLAYARSGEYALAYQAFLQAGQAELAREMEQYLPAAERDQIRASVAGRDKSSAPASVLEEAQELDDADVEAVEEDADEEGEEAAQAAEQAEAAAPEPVPEHADASRGMISRAVEQALPSAAAAAGAARVAMGNRAPMSLSEFATARLIRPEDGDHTFETSTDGVLLIRVNGRVYSRTEGVNVTGGELAYEVAQRHVRGSSTGEEFSIGGRQLFIVSGHGHLIAAPLGEHFTSVMLDDDILYLREELVFAFEDELRWENGHVPGSKATIKMVQFRGHGSVAFRSRRPLMAIKLALERVLYVDAHVLAGWIGRVVPRAVAPAAGGDKSTLFVECTGEGVVLVEEEDGGAPSGSFGPNQARPLGS